MNHRSLLALAIAAAGCATPTAPAPTAPATAPTTTAPPPTATAPAPAATAPAPAPTADAAPFTVQVTGHGPPVIFIPGLSSPGSVWDQAVAHLSARHTCYVFTLAGFAGVPPLPGPAFLTVERDAILAYLRAHKLERPLVVGHSLGGFLAYWIAVRAPGEIRGVLAVDGVPFMPALGDPAATAASAEPLAAQLRDGLSALDHAQFVRQTRAALQAMITRPADVDRVAADGERSDPRTVSRAVYDLMTTDLRRELAGVRVPVWLVLAGDAPGMRAAYEAQVAAAPDHRVVVAAQARHFVMLDDPGLMHATLDELLARVAP